VAYGPSEVQAKIGGTDISIREETVYPFGGGLKFTVHAVSPVRFPLLLRLPRWAANMVVHVNGVPVSAGAGNARTGFFPIEREWRDGDAVNVALPMTARVSHWYHNSVAFEAGPLVFALPLKGQWNELKKYAEKSADWEVRPSRAWNYAVKLGDCDTAIREHSIAEVPFDAQQPAITLKVHGRELPQWTLVENSAGPIPTSPVTSTKPEVTLSLVPYGAAKVRVTVFPYLDESTVCHPGLAQQ